MKTFQLMTIRGIPVLVKPEAVYASLGLWIVAAILGAVMWDLGLITALITGLIVVMLHWMIALQHHYGHVVAGQQMGYPMSRIVCWMLLPNDRYPPNEPSLPASVHRRRAIGGPIASLILSIITGIIALVFYFGVGGVLGGLAIFAFLDAFIIMFLGGFVPLHFIGLETDGSTFLKYWGQ
jgi:hypothetical protein